MDKSYEINYWSPTITPRWPPGESVQEWGIKKAQKSHWVQKTEVRVWGGQAARLAGLNTRKKGATERKQTPRVCKGVFPDL